MILSLATATGPAVQRQLLPPLLVWMGLDLRPPTTGAQHHGDDGNPAVLMLSGHDVLTYMSLSVLQVFPLAAPPRALGFVTVSADGGWLNMVGKVRRVASGSQFPAHQGCLNHD
jgi:hypothetical protein